MKDAEKDNTLMTGLGTQGDALRAQSWAVQKNLLREHEAWRECESRHQKYAHPELDRGDGKLLGEKLIGGKFVRHKSRSVNAKVGEEVQKAD